jgi:hypothetical protein
MTKADNMGKRPNDIEKHVRGIFALTIIVVLAVIIGLNHLIGMRPTELEACARSCEARGMQGQLIHKFTAEQTAGMHGKGPTECACRR